LNRENQEDTLSEGIALQGMVEDGMSLKTFEMVLRWLYTGSPEYVETSDLDEVMELISMADLIGLKSLVRVCELQLSSMVVQYPMLAEACSEFVER